MSNIQNNGEKYVSYDDFKNITLHKPTTKDVLRLMSQLKGDPSFFVLCIFVFFESYIRHNFPEYGYVDDTSQDKVCFWMLEKALKKYHFFMHPKNKEIYYALLNKYKKEHNIRIIPEEDFPRVSKTINKEKNEEINKLLKEYNDTLKKLCSLKKLSDKVRHNYEVLDSGLIDTVIDTFKNFSKLEGFNSKDIEKIPHYANWDACKAPVDNEQYNKLIEEMEAISKAYKQDESKLTEMALKLEKEARKNQSIEEEKARLQEDKNKLSEKYDALRQKSFDLKEELKRIMNNHASSSDIKKLENELETVKKQKDEQEALLSRKQKEIDTLIKDNRSLKEANESFKEEKEKISKTLENTEKERLYIQKEIQQLKSQANLNSETEKKLQKLTDEYNKILAKETEQENLLLEKQKEIDTLNESYEDLSLMNADLAKQKEETENKLKEAVSSSNLLLSKIQELESNPIPDNKTLKELEDLKKEYAILQTEQESQRDNLKVIQEKHLKDIEKLKKDAELYLENASILQAYTSANRNYHSRILNLSTEQKNIIDEIYEKINTHKEKNTDFLIKGGPGTGKTLVLIKLLEKIVTNEPSKKTRLLTYTDALSKYNQYLSEEYEKKSTTSKKDSIKKKKNVIKVMNTHIETFDSYFKPSISKILGKDIYEINQKADNYKETEEYQRLLNLFKSVLKGIDTQDQEIALAQALNEIWVFCPTEQSYTDNSYQGVNAKLTTEQIENRQKIWNYVMKVTAELNKQTALPLEFAYYKIATNTDYSVLSDEYKLDYLLIDEIQDLSPSRIRLLSKLNKYACVMAGDLNQSVFIKRQLSWIELGMKFKDNENDPNIKKLANNYRSTIPVQNLANSYRRICKIKDDNAVSIPFIPGQRPEFAINRNLDESFNNILTKVQCFIDVMRFNAKDICIVVPTDEDLIRIKGLLSDNHLEALKIDDSRFDFKKSNDVIRLSTTKMVKGIDSPIIILLLSESFTDLSKNGNTDAMSQMNSIYSCITRTMDILSIQTTEKALRSNLDSNEENAITKLFKIWKESDPVINSV